MECLEDGQRVKKGTDSVIEGTPFGIDYYVAAFRYDGMVPELRDVCDLLNVRAVRTRAEDGAAHASTSSVRS